MKPLSREALARFEYLADADGEWWPFSFLRPRRHERFGSARCALLACLYGVPPSVFGLLIGRLWGDPVADIHLTLLPFAVCSITFIVFRCTLAVFWNRRAVDLQRLMARRSTWRAGIGARSDNSS